MAIAIVGTPTVATGLSGADATLAMPSGLTQNDLVIVVSGCIGTTKGGEKPVSGALWTVEKTDGNTTMNGRVLSMYQGATPETQIVLEGTGVAGDAILGLAIAFRGVDLTTKLDVAIASNVANTTNPDPPSATSATAGAQAIAAAVSDANEPSITVQSGYGHLQQGNANSTKRISGAISDKALPTAGAEDPGAFTSWVIGRHVAYTIILRPAGGGGGGGSAKSRGYVMG